MEWLWISSELEPYTLKNPEVATNFLETSREYVIKPTRNPITSKNLRSVRPSQKPFVNQILEKFSEKTDYITDFSVSDEEPIEFVKLEPIVNRVNQENPLVAIIYETQDEEPTQNPGTHVRFCAWNVAGIRSNIKKGGFDFLTEIQPDVMPLQEIKCPEEKIPAAAHIPGYYCYFEPGKKMGYG